VSATQEVRCKACGALNRVREHSFRQMPKCGSCHAPLPEGAATRFLRWIHARRNYLWPAYLGILASPLALLAWLGSGTRDISARGIVECPAQAQPRVGDYLITDFAPRVAPFELNTESGLDYLVKLERANERTSALWFYVVGGQTFQTRVPLGTYALKYLAGKTWCGQSLYFGNKQAERGRALLTFSEDAGGIDGHTVTLYGVPHGSFDTQVMSMDDF